MIVGPMHLPYCGNTVELEIFAVKIFTVSL